jgi:uncharacterized protein YjcR
MMYLGFILLFLILVGVLLAVMLAYSYRAIKGSVSHVVKKGSKIASEQQQKWAEREQRKKLPELIQKAYQQMDSIQKNLETLPDQWKLPLRPVVEQSQDILYKVSSSPDKTDQIRSFFNQTLGALLQLLEKLKTDHAFMDAEQTDKARQNITVIKADLIRHQQKMDKLKRFDFDVVMDVIKARLR